MIIKLTKFIYCDFTVSPRVKSSDFSINFYRFEAAKIWGYSWYMNVAGWLVMIYCITLVYWRLLWPVFFKARSQQTRTKRDEVAEDDEDEVFIAVNLRPWVIEFQWLFQCLFFSILYMMKDLGWGLKTKLVKKLYWLVVWNMFYFSIYWECHHPNWRTHSIIFQRGRWLNHQPVYYEPSLTI